MQLLRMLFLQGLLSSHAVQCCSYIHTFLFILFSIHVSNIVSVSVNKRHMYLILPKRTLLKWIILSDLNSCS